MEICKYLLFFCKAIVGAGIVIFTFFHMVLKIAQTRVQANISNEDKEIQA